MNRHASVAEFTADEIDFSFENIPQPSLPAVESSDSTSAFQLGLRLIGLRQDLFNAKSEAEFRKIESQIVKLEVLEQRAIDREQALAEKLAAKVIDERCLTVMLESSGMIRNKNWRILPGGGKCARNVVQLVREPSEPKNSKTPVVSIWLKFRPLGCTWEFAGKASYFGETVDGQLIVKGTL